MGCHSKSVSGFLAGARLVVLCFRGAFGTPYGQPISQPWEEVMSRARLPVGRIASLPVLASHPTTY